MSKFKPGDIVVGQKPGQWLNRPHVVLGSHTFPDGTPAYRIRSCLPQYDDLDGTELWETNDGYIAQAYLDDFRLLWSPSGRQEQANASADPK